MPSRSPLHPLRCGITLTALLIAIASIAACSRGSQSVAPSALTANPSNYDGASVTVSGTVRNPTTHLMRRGPATTYQLCDSACINVIQFGQTNVGEGSQATVTGRFRASFGRSRTMTNVLVVGGRMGT